MICAPWRAPWLPCFTFSLYFNTTPATLCSLCITMCSCAQLTDSYALSKHSSRENCAQSAAAESWKLRDSQLSIQTAQSVSHLCIWPMHEQLNMRLLPFLILYRLLWVHACTRHVLARPQVDNVGSALTFVNCSPAMSVQLAHGAQQLKLLCILLALMQSVYSGWNYACNEVPSYRHPRDTESH